MDLLCQRPTELAAETALPAGANRDRPAAHVVPAELADPAAPNAVPNGVTHQAELERGSAPLAGSRREVVARHPKEAVRPAEDRVPILAAATPARHRDVAIPASRRVAVPVSRRVAVPVSRRVAATTATRVHKPTTVRAEASRAPRPDVAPRPQVTPAPAGPPPPDRLAPDARVVLPAQARAARGNDLTAVIRGRRPSDAGLRHGPRRRVATTAARRDQANPAQVSIEAPAHETAAAKMTPETAALHPTLSATSTHGAMSGPTRVLARSSGMPAPRPGCRPCLRMPTSCCSTATSVPSCVP
jgi:hypothetical protein